MERTSHTSYRRSCASSNIPEDYRQKLFIHAQVLLQNGPHTSYDGNLLTDMST